MPTSRVLDKSTNVSKAHPIGTIDSIAALPNVKAITSTDILEVWGDGAIWDTTTNTAVCIDKFNITGTPRKRQ